MSSGDTCVVTCALTGVLTNPQQFPVPVTSEEMAQATRQAFDAGATIVHCHFRDQGEGMGHLPTWDPDVVAGIVDAIRTEVPEIIINLTTGVMDDDISGPVACLDRVKPEMAALNSGSLNYLKTRRSGEWAWPPLLFANPVEKVQAFIDAMDRNNVVPECECFDTGILRSVMMYQHNGMLKPPVHVSLVMGVASGMPAKPEWLPLLIEEMTPETAWQVIGIGREDVWALHRRAAELGGNVRTGLEDTFYLPDGSKANSNGELVNALAKVVQEAGRTVATPAQAREIVGAHAG